MESFLRIKHWQLFSISFVSYFFAMMTVKLLDLSPEITPVLPIVFKIIAAAGSILGTVWLYTVVNRFHKRFSPAIKTNIRLFNSCIYFVATYQVLETIVFNRYNYQPLLVWFLAWISFGCWLYASYVAANFLVSVERKQPVTLRNFAWEFIGFFFYPAGIWFLQPRVNRLAVQEPVNS